MALLLLLRGLRLAVDVLLLLLDLNFFLVSSLLAALLWLLAAIANLPAACWHGLLLAAGGLAQAAAGVLRGCWAAVEGAKALGQLLALRGREALRQGVVGLLGSGQAALRQACEGAAIAGSLLAYLVNSAVNMGLLGAQSLVALLLALWDAVVSPALRLAELLAACLAHVSSSAIALSILLWSPCQLACEMLASFAELLVGVFFVNVYGLGLLLAIIGVGAVVFNPGVLWVLTGHFHALPAYRRLQREAWRLYQVAVLMLGMALTSQAWRRMVDWSLQVTNWSRGGRMTNRDSERRGAAVPPPRPAALGRLMLAVAGQEEQPDVEQVPQARPALGRSSAAGQRLQPPREEPSTSRGKAPRREQLNVAAGDGAPDDDPWMLLKEQEERKKCVICQDQTKTVLLLPCRHLCLCQECTEVLLQQAIYQRNCPLCRQMILQTLNVYL